MSDSTLYLVDSDTKSLHGEARRDGQDVVFPEDINGWTDVMDCRGEPYAEKSVEENCELAHHVRKFYILITPEQWEEHADSESEEPATAP
jgi:hypothetical protein